MAAVAAIIPSISTVNLHFQASLKKGFGLDSTRRRRRLNSLVSITRACLLHCNAPLLESAAKHTVDTFIKSGMVVGLGSGLASCIAIQYLGQQLRVGAIKDIVRISTSVGSASEAAKAGIPLDHYQDTSQVDCKGRNLLFKRRIYSMLFNWMETAEEIEDLFLGDAEVWRRPFTGHAGPTGGDFPLITREGHNVLDVIFTSPILDLVEVANTLENIDGVVDHGVISKIPSRLGVMASAIHS
ncbi:unnamed protein product [Camellia sinensis]